MYWAGQVRIFRQSTQSHQNPWNKYWEILLNVQNKSTLWWNPSRWKSSQIWVMCWICLHTYMIMNPVTKRRKASNVTKSKIITVHATIYFLFESCCSYLFVCSSSCQQNITKPTKKKPGENHRYPPSEIISDSSQPPDPARLLMEVKVSLCRFPNLKSARVNQLLRLGINSSHL